MRQIVPPVSSATRSAPSLVTASAVGRPQTGAALKLTAYPVATDGAIEADTHATPPVASAARLPWNRPKPGIVFCRHNVFATTTCLPPYNQSRISRMLGTCPKGAAFVALIVLMIIPPASAQPLPAELQNRNVEIVYKEPRSAAFKPIAERVKQRRVLEQ